MVVIIVVIIVVFVVAVDVVVDILIVFVHVDFAVAAVVFLLPVELGLSPFAVERLGLIQDGGIRIIEQQKAT